MPPSLHKEIRHAPPSLTLLSCDLLRHIAQAASKGEILLKVYLLLICLLPLSLARCKKVLSSLRLPFLAESLSFQCRDCGLASSWEFWLILALRHGWLDFTVSSAVSASIKSFADL